MKYTLTFFDFKRKHGLGHSQMQAMTGCNLAESRAYCKGAPITDDMSQFINAVDIIIDQIKTNSNVYTNTDAQHAAHIIEQQNKEIATLKDLLARYDNAPKNIRVLKSDGPWMDEEKQINLPVSRGKNAEHD